MRGKSADVFDTRPKLWISCNSSVYCWGEIKKKEKLRKVAFLFEIPGFCSSYGSSGGTKTSTRSGKYIDLTH